MSRRRPIHVGDHLIAIYFFGTGHHVVVDAVPADQRDDTGSEATTVRGASPLAWVRLGPRCEPTPWPTAFLVEPDPSLEVVCACPLYVRARNLVDADRWARTQRLHPSRWTYCHHPRDLHGREITLHQIVRLPGWWAHPASPMLDAILDINTRRADRYGCAAGVPIGPPPAHPTPDE